MDEQDGRGAGAGRLDDPWYDALAAGWGEPVEAGPEGGAPREPAAEPVYPVYPVDPGHGASAGAGAAAMEYAYEEPAGRGRFGPGWAGPDRSGPGWAERERFGREAFGDEWSGGEPSRGERSGGERSGNEGAGGERPARGARPPAPRESSPVEAGVAVEPGAAPGPTDAARPGESVRTGAVSGARRPAPAGSASAGFVSAGERLAVDGRDRHAAVYLAVQRSAAFQEVRRRYRRFVLPATALFLLWYFAYVIMSTAAPELMGHQVAGELNVAMLAGLGQFATTFLLTWAYARHARLRRDRVALELRWETQDLTGGNLR